MRTFKGFGKHPPGTLVIQSVIEATASLSAATITLPFLEEKTPWYLHPYVVTGAMLLINNALRLKMLDFDDPLSNWFIQKTRSFLFSVVDALYKSVLIHELGHVLITKLLYPHSSFQILIYPPFGGISYNTLNDPRSALSLMLSEPQSEALISLAGSAAELLCCSLYLIIAQMLAQQYSEIKSHLRFSVVFSVLWSAWYALSALWACKPEEAHDFCQLRTISPLSPIIAAALIIGISLGLQLLLSYCCPTPNREEVETKKDPLFKNGLTFFQTSEDPTHLTSCGLSAGSSICRVGKGA